MILILTSESGDLSHLEIVNWLEYYKANYLVVTGESIIRGAVDFTYSSLEGIIYKGNLSVNKFRLFTIGAGCFQASLIFAKIKFLIIL